jgi:hypothetical protein
MSKNDNRIEDRLASIEARLEKLEVSGVLIEEGSITITSPKGEHKIVLNATDKGAGIWLQQADTHKPYVSIYNGFYDQGAVVAVTGYHGPDHPMKAHDVAIMSGLETHRHDGGIQMAASDGTIHQFSTESFLEKKDEGGKKD